MSPFKLNGQSFEEGATFTVTTPELGTVEVKATIQPFSRGHILGLDFGWIKTPQPCRANLGDGTNAKLSFYTNGMGYTTVQCAYLCPCGQNVHPRYYEWDNVSVEGNMIIVGPARVEKKRVPAPITPPPPTVIARPTPPPAPPPTVSKKPKSKDNSTGQLSFF